MENNDNESNKLQQWLVKIFIIMEFIQLMVIKQDNVVKSNINKNKQM